MSHKIKIFLINLITTVLILLILYFLYFIKISFDNHENAPYLFKTTDKLNFHIKYSKKIHHLRDSDGKWEIKNNKENYLFSIINNYSNDNTNIILLGDSWIEQISSNIGSEKIFETFAKNNNYGLINAGITSFSPSLMQLQYEILEKDFNIKPDAVVVYIDQTDIGDEICRYKDKRFFNENKDLVGVGNEKYSRATYDYTKLYAISDIKLNNDSKMLRSYKLTNFFIKYSFFRFIKKVESIKKFGWENKEISKCRFNEIRKYLINSTDDEVNYFKDRLSSLINFFNKRKYIKKIIFVTFPHKGHIFGDFNDQNVKENYLVNVSDIVDNILKNHKNINHLNFTKLFFDSKIDIKESYYMKNDPGSHLNADFHASIFVREIINQLK